MTKLNLGAGDTVIEGFEARDVKRGDCLFPLPEAEVDESYRQRPAYEDGYLTDEPDLSRYDPTPRDEDETDLLESEDEDG